MAKEKSPHHQLAWIGYLNLPVKDGLGAEERLELREPVTWEKWSAFSSIDWLPKSNPSASTKRKMPLLIKYRESFKTRRQWRKAR